MGVKEEIVYGVGDVLPKKCDVRLSEAEMKMLNQLADENEVTKSDIMRKALRFLYTDYTKES